MKYYKRAIPIYDSILTPEVSCVKYCGDSYLLLELNNGKPTHQYEIKYENPLWNWDLTEDLEDNKVEEWCIKKIWEF